MKCRAKRGIFLTHLPASRHSARFKFVCCTYYMYMYARRKPSKEKYALHLIHSQILLAIYP